MEIQFIPQINRDRRLWFIMRLTYETDVFEIQEFNDMTEFCQYNMQRFIRLINRHTNTFLGIQGSFLLSNGARYNSQINTYYDMINEYIRNLCEVLLMLNQGQELSGMEMEWRISGNDDYDIIDARSGFVDFKVGFTSYSNINFPEIVTQQDFSRNNAEDEIQQERENDDNVEEEEDTEEYDPFSGNTEEYNPYSGRTEEYNPYSEGTEEYDPFTGNTEEYDPFSGDTQEYEVENQDPIQQQILNNIDKFESELTVLKRRENDVQSLIKDIERNKRIKNNREVQDILKRNKEELKNIKSAITICRRQLRNMRRQLR